MILLNTFSLIQALAELYVIDGQYEKAFSLYADVSVLNAHSQKKKKRRKKKCFWCTDNFICKPHTQFEVVTLLLITWYYPWYLITSFVMPSAYEPKCICLHRKTQSLWFDSGKGIMSWSQLIYSIYYWMLICFCSSVCIDFHLYNHLIGSDINK